MELVTVKGPVRYRIYTEGLEAYEWLMGFAGPDHERHEHEIDWFEHRGLAEGVGDPSERVVFDGKYRRRQNRACKHSH